VRRPTACGPASAAEQPTTKRGRALDSGHPGAQVKRADGSQPVVYEVIVDSEKACLRLSKP
jgi:hypothetical protein